jgi:hypothetical protein
MSYGTIKNVKHHAVKAYGVGRHSSRHSKPQHWMEVKGQLHSGPFLPRRNSGHYPMKRKPTQTPEPMTFRRIDLLLVPGLEPRLQYHKYRGPFTIPRQLNAFCCTQNKQVEVALFKSSETQENVNCSWTTESCMMQAGYCCWISTFMTRQCLARHSHGSWYSESNFKCCLSVHVDNYTIIVPTKCTSFY